MKRIISLLLVLLFVGSAAAEGINLSVGLTVDQRPVVEVRTGGYSVDFIAGPEGIGMRNNGDGSIYRLTQNGTPLGQNGYGYSNEAMMTMLTADLQTLSERLSGLLPGLLSGTSTSALMSQVFAFMSTGKMTFTTADLAGAANEVLMNGMNALFGAGSASVYEGETGRVISVTPRFPVLLEDLQLTELYRNLWDQLALPASVNIPVATLTEGTVTFALEENGYTLSFITPENSYITHCTYLPLENGMQINADMSVNDIRVEVTSRLEGKTYDMRVTQGDTELAHFNAALTDNALTAGLWMQNETVFSLDAEYEEKGGVKFLTVGCLADGTYYDAVAMLQEDKLTCMFSRDSVLINTLTLTKTRDAMEGYPIYSLVITEELYGESVAILEAELKTPYGSFTLTVDTGKTSLLLTGSTYGSEYTCKLYIKDREYADTLLTDPDTYLEVTVNPYSSYLRIRMDSENEILDLELHFDEGRLQSDLKWSRGYGTVDEITHVTVRIDACQASLHYTNENLHWYDSHAIDVDVYYGNGRYGLEMDVIEDNSRKEYRALVESGAMNFSLVIGCVGYSYGYMDYGYELKGLLYPISDDCVRLILTYGDYNADQTYTLDVTLRETDWGSRYILDGSVNLNGEIHIFLMEIESVSSDLINAKLTVDGNESTAICMDIHLTPVKGWTIPENAPFLEVYDILSVLASSENSIAKKGR